jgi:putative cell wall-binding protein
VLLVPGTQSAPTTAVAAQLTRLHPAQLYVVGGTSVVSSKLQAKLATTAAVTRLSGANRYATSVAVGNAFYPSSSNAVIASGLNFPDALVGSVLSGGLQAPLYLSTATCMPSIVVSELQRVGATSLTLMGGTAGLSANVAARKSC